MKTCFGVESLVPAWPGATVCVGVFDGVHVGHQHVIKRAAEDAREAGRPCVVVTFDRHPARVLRPQAAPAMVATLGQSLRAIGACGADLAVVLAFDEAMAATPAQEFFDRVLVGSLRAASVVVGHDFAFGRGREGDAAWLAQRITTTVVPPFEFEGGRASSTRVRDALAEGDVEAAARLLGRPFAQVGCVVQGEQLGRRLGYPTANVAPVSMQAVPGDGVYAGWAEVPGGRYAAAVSVGARPTFAGRDKVVEAHLLDYGGGPLYGRIVEVGFVLRLRAQERFATAEALQRQMAEDVNRCLRANVLAAPSVPTA